ncbi:helix-turn-helix domain-containing protein [Streptococcus sp. S784/96/1]|uniref:helix-turn-helix domain-containing protein n=1 Tax=Streptococcus sp. S784/96/1 TaxID=2653499 RepID=UPI001386A509
MKREVTDDKKVCKELTQEFSENLRKLREGRSLTQKAVARGIGTSQQTYGKYELGSTSPTLRTIEKLLDFFKVEIQDLLG